MNLPINEIICCDVHDGLSKLPDNCIDLVVTSPPYNLGTEYDIWDDSLPWNEYFEWCAGWLKELLRVLKSDGRFCLNHYLSCGTADERVAPLMALNHIATEIGFKHHGLAVWMDATLSRRTAWGSWASASAPYINSPFEGILILFKEQWRKKNRGEDTISEKEFITATAGVWDFGVDRERLTPATFPLKLPELCINLLTFKGELVLDPFMGSGTTALACRKLGRNFIGFEISPKYCAIARERLRKFDAQLKLPFMI